MSDEAARMGDAEANRIIEAAMLRHKQMHAEYFTVPDGEGRLIEIPVRLMTADDIQAALAYLNAEMLRLQGEAAPAERVRQAMLDGRLDPRTPRATVLTAMAALNPSKPTVRGRLQTTASCDGKEPWW